MDSPPPSDKTSAWQRAMCALDASRPSYKILSAIGLLAGGALMQAGCFMFGPCLSVVEPIDYDMTQADSGDDDDDMGDVGPCLSIPLPRDMDVGPCLGALPEDMRPEVEEDMEVGPCLSQMPPPDMKSSLEEDMNVGPCLDVPAPDMGALDPRALEPSKGDDSALGRAQILAKLADRLPADVLAKLGINDLG